MQYNLVPAKAEAWTGTPRDALVLQRKPVKSLADGYWDGDKRRSKDQVSK